MNDYIKIMRPLIGKGTLFTVGCGVILEDQRGRILLQSRKDHPSWCIPGGIMELGETYAEAAQREVFEETNFQVDNLDLFGIYSGPSCYAEYPNGEKAFSVQIIFYTNKYSGVLKQEGEESFEHCFFHKDKLPLALNPRQKPFIMDWAMGVTRPVIK